MKEVFGSAHEVDPATSPYTLNGYSGGSNNYVWKVKSRCSPDKESSYVQGPGFTISVCPKLGNEETINNEGKNRFFVYPNPASGNVILSLKLETEGTYRASIEVLDHIGKVVSVAATEIENGLLNYEMPLNDFSSGFYLARITVDGKTFQSKLFIE